MSFPLVILWGINLFNLLNTKFIKFSNKNNTSDCQYRFSFNKNNLEITPFYSSDLSFKNLTCLGKVVERNGIMYVFENILIFNILKLLLFFSIYFYFKNKKINFKYLFLHNLLIYLIFYFNFNFDFLYRLNLKFFSYEIILFEVLITTIFAKYNIIEIFYQNNLQKKFFENTNKYFFKYYRLLTIVFITRILYLFIYNSDLQNGLFEEWLINYKFGFIKRGFPGTIIFLIEKNLNIDRNYIFVFLIILIYTLFFNQLKKLLSNKTIDLLLLLILFSPIFITFNTHLISTLILPKEMLGILAFLYLLNSKTTKNQIFTIIFYIISVLSHEVNFLFFVPFSIYLYNKNKKVLYSFVIINFSLLAMLILYEKSTEVMKLICNDQFYNSYSNCYKLTALENSIKSHFYYSIETINIYYFLIYTIYFIFGFIPIIFTDWLKINKNKIIFIALPVFSLMSVTLDWGRWLNIFFSIIFLIYISEKSTNFYPKNLNILILSLLYLISWKVPQWGINKDYITYIIRFDKLNLLIISYFFINVLLFYKQKQSST